MNTPSRPTGPPVNRALELRSIANSIEPMFPDAADLLRGIANEGPPTKPTAHDVRAAVEASFIGLSSCGGVTVDAEGCYAGNVVRAVRAAMEATAWGQPDA